MTVKRQLDLNHAVVYHEGRFPPRDLDYPRLIHALSDAEAALARYDQELSRLHNRELFLAPLRGQEAVLSSRIEGTISTLDELLEYDSDAAEQGGSLENIRSDLVETILYRRTLHYAQAELADGRPLSATLLRSMHQMLLSWGCGAAKSPGRFKCEQNYIGDGRSRVVSYLPISPERLPEGLERLFAYLASDAHPPIIRTALAHLGFEALHPFLDGNGRIGRMLITLLLWSYGKISSPHFFISRYLEEHKGEYLQRMRAVSGDDDWTGWVLFFLEAVKAQSEYNLQVTQQIGDLYGAMKGIFSELTGSKHSIALLDAIFSLPVFRNRQIAKCSGISAASVHRYTKALLADDRRLLRIVRPPAGRRPAIYAFEPLLELVRG